MCSIIEDTQALTLNDNLAWGIIQMSRRTPLCFRGIYICSMIPTLQSCVATSWAPSNFCCMCFYHLSLWKPMGQSSLHAKTLTTCPNYVLPFGIWGSNRDEMCADAPMRWILGRNPTSSQTSVLRIWGFSSRQSSNAFMTQSSASRIRAIFPSQNRSLDGNLFILGNEDDNNNMIEAARSNRLN